MSEHDPLFVPLGRRRVIQTVEWVPQNRPEIDRRRLLAQVAIPNGTNSCYLTSALNGAIVGGYLTKNEAQSAQDLITTDPMFDICWGNRNMLGQNLRVWRVGNDISAMTRRAIGKTFPIRPINEGWCDITPDTSAEFLRQRLLQGYTISWGNDIHQTLAVGVEDKGKVEIVNPLRPLNIEYADLPEMVRHYNQNEVFSLIGSYSIVGESTFETRAS